MGLATGAVEYNLGALPVTGIGLSFASQDLDDALAGPVGGIVFDETGKADLASLLSGLPDTDFKPAALRGLLSDSKTPENWRVGEALAEAYLVEHRDCTFPWPDGRDERKSGSSLPGADLVGFKGDGADSRFAFGEVKTSSEKKYPPGAMHGETGLKQQLEDLRDKLELRSDLVKYLGHRAMNASWKVKFQQAATKYLKDSADIAVFGVMVRDVTPNQDDIRVRVSKLGSGSPQGMVVELLVIYLPESAINTLSEKVVRFRAKGNA